MIGERRIISIETIMVFLLLALVVTLVACVDGFCAPRLVQSKVRCNIDGRGS